MLIFCKKNADSLQKNADISKIKRALVPHGIFLKLHMCVYLRTKFQVSSIILRSFRQGVILPPLPAQYELLRSPPRLGLKFALALEQFMQKKM